MSAERRQGETVKPLELFFDLVFVLGFTQCTALMVHDHSWQGLARGVLVRHEGPLSVDRMEALVEPQHCILHLSMNGALAGAGVEPVGAL